MDQKQFDYYESNLKALQEHHPSLFKQITQNPPEPFGKISYAPNGNPNLTVTNDQGTCVMLHDETNPEKETLNFLEKIDTDDKGFLAILGMGLGYSILKILTVRPHLQRLAIFELNPGIFIQALKHIDFRSVLKDPRLILCIGTEASISTLLTPASRTMRLEDSRTLHHRPSFNFDPDGYNRLKDTLFDHINALNVAGTTAKLLGNDFLNNRFENMSTIHHHLLLDHIKNRFNKVPAILVAGGPSLDKNIHQLKQAQEKAVIIAVDTVLPALLKNGVHPHFLTCIDPNNLTFEKFANAIPQINKIALICASGVNPKTPKTLPADQIFWVFSGNPMEAWLNHLIGGKIVTSGASTVAHLNLVAAHILGCDPIIFIGQDLAYADSSSASHAKGTILQGVAPKDKAGKDIQGETVIGINGKTLRTNRSFLSMKRFFENGITHSDKIHINATQGGADIKGTQILTLQESMDQHCTSQVNAGKRLQECYSTAVPIDMVKTIVEFNKMIHQASRLQRLIKKSDAHTIALLTELTKTTTKDKPIISFKMLTHTQKKQVRKIDTFHLELDNTPNVWKILEEVTMEGLKESERQNQDISILENDPERFIEWLIKSLHRRLTINKIRKEVLNLLVNNLNKIISFHQKERKYLKQDKLKLASLYINAGNYHLASPLLETLFKEMPESGEVHFYLGCSAMQSHLLKEATHYFQTAIKLNPKLIRHINTYLQELGDDFLKFALYFKDLPGRDLSIKHMVKKGLEYNPRHQGLQKELENILKQDLEIIKSDIDAENYKTCAPLIEEWYQSTINLKNIFRQFSPDLICRIYLYQGKLFLSQKDYQNALKAFKTAMKYSPNAPDIHTNLIDTLFVLGDFDSAINALNTAVKIDTRLAAYWETIGDSLQQAGQDEEAIIAYEKCYVHLPENIQLLRKIGDSYLNTDQLEAARAAYEALKIKMEEK